MKILAFESSCDETASAVIEGDEKTKQVKILSSCVASQIEVHALYGGVVPEIASRAHCEAISSLCHSALVQAGMTMEDIDAVAVTAKPGLIGALLVGVNFAKSLAYAYNKPLIGVDHIRAHIAANYLSSPELRPPFFALVASGGHTSLILVKSHTDFETVGRTRDDAMGEAFDKVGRVMGIPYPGGAQMDALASAGDKKAIEFPSAAVKGDTLDFSFSGLKTAVINYLHNCDQKGISYSREDVAASFTDSVCRSVKRRVEEAHARYHFSRLALAGGVAANSHLRSTLEDFAKKNRVEFFCPPRSLCGDNAAMVGAQAFFDALSGDFADISLNPTASGKDD